VRFNAPGSFARSATGTSPHYLLSKERKSYGRSLDAFGHDSQAVARTTLSTYQCHHDECSTFPRASSPSPAPAHRRVLRALPLPARLEERAERIQNIVAAIHLAGDKLSALPLAGRESFVENIDKVSAAVRARYLTVPK